MTMKAVRIAELKSRLSEYLRAVRRGHSLTVLDRETPIAQIVPYSGNVTLIAVRQPLPTSGPLRRIPLPPPLSLNVDAVELLLEERLSER